MARIRHSGPQRSSAGRHQRRGRQSPGAPASRRDHGAHEREELVTGVLRFERDGGARLVPDERRGPPIHLGPEELGGYAEGDVVTVRLERGRKGRVRGRIVGRGRRRGAALAGIVHVSGNVWMLLPEPDGAPLLLEPQHRAGASEGDAVAARILDPGGAERAGRAEVTEVLGRPADPRVQVELLVRGLGLPLAFDETVLAEASEAPTVDAERVLGEEPSRHDLRGVPHVTIDGADARDFDDAVAAHSEQGGVRVWVSIADVSHYVRPRTALDESARERGTSVYFPHRAIPMLPERLSNDLCSLKPHVPRLTLTAEMLVRPDGRTEDVRVYPSIIASAARLTYEEVQRAIDRGGGPAATQASLPDLVTAARALREQRKHRGAVDLELPEARVVLDEDGVATDIRERPRLEAHRVIEDLMIAANEAVAELLLARSWPGVYRVHEPPDPERLAMLADWAESIGLSLDPEAARKPRGLAHLARALTHSPSGSVGMMLLLRSMAQARYAAGNLGHYGLASQAYVHFTSPIRRYPDLLVHRSLRALWEGKRPRADLEAEAERSSMQERRAAEAERAVVQLMACHVAERHLGEAFDAVVTGVHRAGVFVRVKDPWIEGLVPMSSLGDAHGDYYDLVIREHAVVGRRSGHRLALGDTVPVRLAGVSTYRRHIDFQLVRAPREAERPAATAQRRRPRGKPGRAERPARERPAAFERPARERTGRPERTARERPAAFERPARERTGRPERPERERHAGFERPARERTGRPERTARERPGGFERPARERTGRPERTGRERPGGFERPARERTGGSERTGRERPGGFERPARERTGGSERPVRGRRARPGAEWPARPPREHAEGRERAWGRPERADGELRDRGRRAWPGAERHEERGWPREEARERPRSAWPGRELEPKRRPGGPGRPGKKRPGEPVAGAARGKARPGRTGGRKAGKGGGKRTGGRPHGRSRR